MMFPTFSFFFWLLFEVSIFLWMWLMYQDELLVACALNKLRSIGPVSENLLFRKKISENLVERELLQAQEPTQGSLK